MYFFLFYLFIIFVINQIQMSFTSKNMNLRSLIFIFDTTESIDDHLEKDAAVKIIETFSENETNIIGNYIFVPFNYPNIGPVINTNNKTEFKHLINGIQVRGGNKDCPENTLGGIKTGLEMEFCLDNSFVYVFTDADPKDKNLLIIILELIERKKAQVFFLLMGICGSKVADEYEKIAACSSGLIFDLSKQDINSVLGFIRFSLQSELDEVVLLAVDSQTNQEYQNNRMYNVSVNKALKNITIVVRGDNVSISFTDPSGQQFQDALKKSTILVNLEKIKAISIQAPTIGLWKINVGKSKNYILRVTGTLVTSYVTSKKDDGYSYSIIFLIAVVIIIIIFFVSARYWVWIKDVLHLPIC